MVNNKLITYFVLLLSTTFAQNFGEIYFRNQNDGLMIFGDRNHASYKLLKTTDSGDSWNEILSASFLKSISQVTDNKIFVGYKREGIAYTENGGVDWQYNDFGKAEVNVKKIQFINSNQGWVLSKEAVFITSDGGTSWTEIGVGGYTDALSISVIDTNNIWMVNEEGDILKHNPDGSFPEWTMVGELGGTCYGDNAGITFVDSLRDLIAGIICRLYP